MGTPPSHTAAVGRQDGRDVTKMAAIGLAIALAAVAAVGVAATISLPDAACNTGTETAHSSIPADTGAGDPVPGHSHVPIAGDDGCTTGGSG